MDQTVLYDLSYGVYVAGSLDGTRPVGCVANTAFQVTAEPMTVGVSLNKLNYTEDCVRKSGYFTLSVLSENTPQEVIGRFGFQSSKEVDKFDGLRYQKVGADGFPVLDEKVCSWILCRVIREVDVLTHTVFIGEVVDLGRLEKEPPMTYAYYHKVKNGKTAKNAPTYIAEPDAPAAVEKRYVCGICGYVYEGTAAEFEALPADWKCPVCGMGKDKFKLK